MGESRAISTTVAGKQWASVTVVPTLYFVGLDQGHRRNSTPTQRYTSSCTMSHTRWDYPAISRPGWSDRGGDSPKFLGHSDARPRQPASTTSVAPASR